MYICAKTEDSYLTAYKRVRSEPILHFIESEYIESGHIMSLQISEPLIKCSVLFVVRFLEWRQCLKALLKMHW